MDRTSLEERRQQAEREFNELEKRKAQIDVRQSELRGQYQVLTEQMDALDAKVAEKKAKRVSPKADVIDVTAVEGATK